MIVENILLEVHLVSTQIPNRLPSSLKHTDQQKASVLKLRHKAKPVPLCITISNQRLRFLFVSLRDEVPQLAVIGVPVGFPRLLCFFITAFGASLESWMDTLIDRVD